MRKGTDLISKPVIAMDSGEKVQTISDLVFDQVENVLLGFVVDEGGWFSDAKVLPLQMVETIGPDAILIASKDSIVEAGRVPAIKQILQRNNILKGTQIYTTDGRDLGKMADLYFDETTGSIEGYDVSGGVFADALSGRSFVPATHTFTIGEDAAFVPPEVATMMEVQEDGGIKGTLHQATDTIKEKVSDAQSAVTNKIVDPEAQKAFVLGKTVDEDVKTPDNIMIVPKGMDVTPLAVENAEEHGVLDALYRATGGSISQHVADKASDTVSNATASVTLDQARGRRAMQAVQTPEGMYIVAAGQIINDRVIERAKQYDREAQLLQSAGLSSGDAAQGAAQATGDKIAQGASTVKHEASNLWDTIKTKVSEVQDRTAQQLEEKRIEHALGRPTTRVILDKQDNVILNTGEIITHKAIEMARQADVLGVLLSSVFDHEPPLAPEASRAPDSGAAALDREQEAG